MILPHRFIAGKTPRSSSYEEPKKDPRKTTVFAGLLQYAVVYQPGEWAQQDLNL